MPKSIIFTLLLILSRASVPIASAQNYSKQNLETVVFGTTEKLPFNLVGNIYYLPKDTYSLPREFDVNKSVGTVYTKELNILPRSFQAGFPGITDRFEWFAIDYHGFFFIQYEGKTKVLPTMVVNFLSMGSLLLITMAGMNPKQN